MPDGRYEAAEALEGDGVAEGDLWIRVAATIAGDGMTVDFTGTDPPGRATATARRPSPARPSTSWSAP